LQAVVKWGEEVKGGRVDGVQQSPTRQRDERQEDVTARGGTRRKRRRRRRKNERGRDDMYERREEGREGGKG